MAPRPEAPQHIRNRYASLLQEKSNIAQHLPGLRALAEQCEAVTEFGTQTGRSACAFLMAQPASLRCYDLQWTGNFLALLQPGTGRTIVERHQGNILELKNLPTTDLLLIDSTHTFEHVAHELRLARDSVRRWICLHDTMSCGEVGILREREGMPGVDYFQTRKRSEGQYTKGIMPAIVGFLAASPGWKVLRHDTFNNGMMYLERTSQ